MATMQAYIARLRCRTWHGWPENALLQSEIFALDLHDGSTVHARAALITYLARQTPSDYTVEPTEQGPLVWRGEMDGLYTVRDSILKDPADVIEVSWLLGFHFPGELPKVAHESLRRALFALLSLVNLRLGDYLTPAAPMQIAKIHDPGHEIDSTISVHVQTRSALVPQALQTILTEYTANVFGASKCAGLQVALDLYGSHFAERNVQTRFLLLVMALEVLAVPTSRSPDAQGFLDRWTEELTTASIPLAADSPEHAELDDLIRGVRFLRQGSIRGRVRELARVAATSNTDSGEWARRAVKVYDKRSQLVHEGSLPAAELGAAEDEARLIVEMVLTATIEKPAAEQ